MNFLSLFAGIGGLDLGLERAGMTCVGQVEIDEFCQRVLARHWPNVPRHDDVRTAVDWWRSTVRPPVDLVTGGFPCQPFSGAGLQLGMADERWGWPWFFAVVDALRPRYVLIENVAALLRDTDAFSVILSDLSGLGFAVEWSVVSACSLGASHRRRRLFVVAYADGEGLQGVHEARGRIDLQPATQTLRRSWPSEPAVARVADGVPRRLVRDPIHALGNTVVPAVSERIGQLVMAGAA
jgi:DNA (cytosine-5)-methyltransferase 1